MQDETAPNVNNVSGLLKAFVILGGVMLIIGMILLAVMIVIRSPCPVHARDLRHNRQC